MIDVRRGGGDESQGENFSGRPRFRLKIAVS
jgi:hypothetical protein